MAKIIICWLLGALIAVSAYACSPPEFAEVTPAPVITITPSSDNSSWYEATIDTLKDQLAKKDVSNAAAVSQAAQLRSELEAANSARGIQTAYHEAQLAQMTELVNRTRQIYFIKTGTVNDFQKQYLEVQERLFDIDAALDTVWNGTVIIETDNWTMPLTDNLTAAEYSTFRKGWELWWWTFNEKPGDE